VLDDFAVADSMNCNPVRLHVLVRRRNAEELARVDPATDDAAHDEVALRHLHRDLVASGGCHAEDLGGLLHPFAIEADTQEGRIVCGEVLREVPNSEPA
jgi:hypothetical protein